MANDRHRQSPHPSQLVQQGVELYQQGDYQNAIARWQTALKIYQDTKNPTNETIVLENLARANQQIGKIDEAIRYWERAIANYRQQGNLTQVGRTLTEQAQAYSNLGQARKAIALLCGGSSSNGDCLEGSALQIAKQQKDPVGEAAALGSLGEAYRQRGDYDLAINYLEQAQKIGNPDDRSSVLNSLGNARASRSQLWYLRANSAQQRGNIPQQQKFQQQADGDRQQALQDFQSSFQLARERDDKPSQMRSLLNLIQLNYRFPQSHSSQTITFNEVVQQALVLFDKLPDTPSKVYAAIDLANLPTISANITSPLTQCPTEKKLPDLEAKKLLERGLEIARNLKDSRAESFAKGALAHFYECQQQFYKALKLNREALWAADQNLLFQDSLYFWEWQAGRIYKKQGKELEAIAAYQRAFQVLEKVRSDLILAERDLQFDFRDLIDPLYRQLAELRLRATSLSSLPPAERQRELTNAVATIDALKLAELQNYFGNDCEFNVISQKNVDELIGKNTAVFSSTIFNDGVAIVLTLPSGEKRLEWISENSQTVKETSDNLRRELGQRRHTHYRYDTTAAKKIYDWIIRPFESDLKREQLDTLVFVQDGILRTIPMAVLYDGQQFLIEKYAIATTPSLRLTAAKTPIAQPNRALILGVTQSAKIDEQTFDALANVPNEISAVQQLLPDSKSLVDGNFDREKLTTELDRDAYPIIHIATHAQFGISCSAFKWGILKS